MASSSSSLSSLRWSNVGSIASDDAMDKCLKSSAGGGTVGGEKIGGCWCWLVMARWPDFSDRHDRMVKLWTSLSNTKCFHFSPEMNLFTAWPYFPFPFNFNFQSHNFMLIFEPLCKKWKKIYREICGEVIIFFTGKFIGELWFFFLYPRCLRLFNQRRQKKRA